MFLLEHKANIPMPAVSLPQAAPTAPLVQPHPSNQPPATLQQPVTRPTVARRVPSPAARPVYVVRGRPGPDDRPCLPPGHPDTWGRITEGTVLDSAPYPFPIFGS